MRNGAPDTPPDTGPDAGRRRRVLVCLLLAAAIALFTGHWMWTAAAERAAAGVHVTAELPECEGAEVGQARVHHDGPRVPVVVLGNGPTADGFRCTTQLQITNDSRRTVHLERMTFPAQGPKADAVVRLDFVGTHWSARQGGVTAVRTLEVDLPPGETRSFDVAHVFNDHGCAASGTFTARVTLSASVVGRGFETGVDRFPAFRHSGRTPGCGST